MWDGFQSSYICVYEVFECVNNNCRQGFRVVTLSRENSQRIDGRDRARVNLWFYKSLLTKSIHPNLLLTANANEQGAGAETGAGAHHHDHPLGHRSLNIHGRFHLKLCAHQVQQEADLKSGRAIPQGVFLIGCF